MNKYFVSLLALLVMVSCKSSKGDPPADKQTKGPSQTIVDVMVAQSQTISSQVEANGTVVANEYVELRPETSGRLVYLFVPEGNLVKKGTIIARINDADLQAQLNKTKVLLDLAQKNEGRLGKLLKVNGVNQSDYDAALSTVNGYKADLVYTQSLIDKTVIKAPFDGMIGLRQVSLGAYLSPAITVATMQQLDKIRIDFTLPEEYSRLIQKGNMVDVTVDATRQTKTKARIIATEPQVDQNTRNLKVRAMLEGGKVNPGAFVKVTVQSGTDNKAIMVPTNAIIQDDRKKQLIQVKNGKANFITVETGVTQADFVEITNGVKQGDTIVVTGVLFARPKSPLKVRSVKALEQLKN